MTTTADIPVDAADMTDPVLAAATARTAGEVLLGVRREGGPTDLRARGDAAAQRTIAEILGRARPDDAVLSEEAVDDPARLSGERVWIVDPLDDTREFSEDGRSDWAMHVALWERGDLTAGAVALPALNVTLSSDAPRRSRPTTARSASP